MAQRSSRKKRKDRQRAATPAAGTATTEADEATEEVSPDEQIKRGYARSRAKNDEARAALVPLKPGEKPTAVIVAGVVAGLLGIGNLASYFAGLEIQGERPQFFGIALYSGLMFLAAWGCFNLRYWAVLGMEALLALGILIFSLLLIKAESFLAVIIGLIMIAACGTLFWFLIKSMARIQMPERPGADR